MKIIEKNIFYKDNFLFIEYEKFNKQTFNFF